MSNNFSSRLGVRGLRTFACLAIVMLGSACVEQNELWTPQEAPKVNKDSWVTFKHGVGFASPTSSLSKIERAKINRFLKEIDIGFSDRVFIRTQKGPENHQVASVIKHIRALRLVPEIIISHTAKRPVSVVVGRYLVTPPRCPDWTKQPGTDSANRRSSNYGCATVTNLGLMVANPGDLIQGRPMGPADGDKAAQSISKYRAGEIEEPQPVTINIGGN